MSKKQSLQVLLDVGVTMALGKFWSTSRNTQLLYLTIIFIFAHDLIITVSMNISPVCFD